MNPISEYEINLYLKRLILSTVKDLGRAKLRKLFKANWRKANSSTEALAATEADARAELERKRKEITFIPERKYLATGRRPRGRAIPPNNENS